MNVFFEKKIIRIFKLKFIDARLTTFSIISKNKMISAKSKKNYSVLYMI